MGVISYGFRFTFTDQTLVEELANNDNKKPLGQISFISKLIIERGGLNVDKNDTVNLGEAIINSSSPKSLFNIFASPPSAVIMRT